MTEIENSIYNFKIALEKNNPDYIMRGDCQIALEALKEKAEREKGCEFCNNGSFGAVIHVKEDRTLRQFYPECCPKCGREL